MSPVAHIKPLAEFLQDSQGNIERLRESQEPELLTVDGEAAVVVQDAGAYERMASLARQAIEDERLARSLAALREGAGDSVSLREAFDRFRIRAAGVNG